jgi:hypothetical protein
MACVACRTRSRRYGDRNCTMKYRDVRLAGHDIVQCASSWVPNRNAMRVTFMIDFCWYPDTLEKTE